MFNRKPIQLGDQLFRPRMKIPQRGILNLVDALDLPHQQLRVADQFESFMSVLDRVLEGSYQSLILGKVIRLMAQILAQCRDFPSALVVNNDAIASRPWIPARPSVAVRDQIMRRHSRRRFAKELASLANRGHLPSLQDELGARLEQTWHSPAGCKPRRQALRQVRGQNALLGSFQIVGHAAERHDSLLRVIHREASAPVTIPRLSHRAGIHQISQPALEWKLALLALADGVIKRAEKITGSITGRETSLQMRVPEKSDCGI